jgi:protein-tyrosine phosphatase
LEARDEPPVLGQLTESLIMSSPALPAVLSDLHATAIAVPGTPLLLNGMFNLRDLGGYATRDGGATRTGRILRADSFAFLTEQDEAEVARLGLALVCDLRSDKELATAPDKLPAGVRYDHNPMRMNNNVMGDVDRSTFDWSAFELETLYFYMLDNSGETFRRIFAHLAEAESYPFLFHCMGGKDRTGVTAALLLRAAGVPDATIVADFALTDRHIQPKIPQFLQRMQQRGVNSIGAEKMLRAPARAMEATLAHIDAHYGLTEDYLQAIGVTVAQIDAFRAFFVA